MNKELPFRCLHCDEAVAPGEPFEFINSGRDRLHLECAIRMAVGSVGHQLGRCTCYGGTEDDPPGATRREAAIAAAKLFRGMSRALRPSSRRSW